MNKSKTSGCEATKTPLAAIGIDDPSKLAVRCGPSFSFKDTRRVILECDEVTFLTDCARIRLKGDDLSRFIGKTRRIVVNGVSFVKEDEADGGE